MKSQGAVPSHPGAPAQLPPAQQNQAKWLTQQLSTKAAGLWLLLLFPTRLDGNCSQSCSTRSSALLQECHGIFWIDGEVHVPLAVNIYLLHQLGSSALSSLPSLWHLWDTSSWVCGITSSSKLFLTLYSYSSSMCLTILKLIWVMTNRIRY